MDLILRDKYKVPESQNLYSYLSRYPFFDLEVVKDFPNKSWDWEALSKHPRLSWSFVKRFHKKLNMSFVSTNPIISWEVVMVHAYIKWCYTGLSENPNINILTVKEYPRRKWDWEKLSRNPSILINDVRDNLDLPWDYKNLSRNPNLTWEFVKMNVHKEWDWSVISKSGFVTWSIIVVYSEFPWDWRSVSMNPNITWDIVNEDMKSLDSKPWDWDGLSLNVNIDKYIIKKYKDLPWNYKSLCQRLYYEGKPRDSEEILPLVYKMGLLALI